MYLVGENKGWVAQPFSNEPAHYVYANSTSACGKIVGRNTRWPAMPPNACLRCRRVVEVKNAEVYK